MNRRQPKVSRWFRAALPRLWPLRRVLLLAIPYLLLLSWLFSGGHSAEMRLDDLYVVQDTPAWRAPDGEHWFGTAANGADLFQASRLALASSVAVSVVAVAFGIGLALLLTALFAFGESRKSLEWLERPGRAGNLVPALGVLVVFAGGARGGVGFAIVGLAALVALRLTPLLGQWFREGETGFEFTAARVLGLTRRHLVLSRLLPSVLRRLAGAFAALVPVVVLAEMSLSFLGFTGGRLGIGGMVARGQDFLIEAPWLVVCPGLLATAVVLALSLLGWRVSVALRTGPLPRFF